MKKYLVSFLAFTLLVLSSNALAEDTVNSSTTSTSTGTIEPAQLPPIKDKEEKLKSPPTMPPLPFNKQYRERHSLLETKRAELEKKLLEIKNTNGEKKSELEKVFKSEVNYLKTEHESLKAEIEKKRVEAKAKLLTLRKTILAEKDKVKARAQEKRILSREKALFMFDGTLNRVVALKNIVSQHVAKFKSKGVDVSTAETLLISADSKTNEIRAKVLEISDLLSQSSEGISAENKVKIKTLKDEIQALLKETHGLLKEAVTSLKSVLRLDLEYRGNTSNIGVE